MLRGRVRIYMANLHAQRCLSYCKRFKTPSRAIVDAAAKSSLYIIVLTDCSSYTMVFAVAHGVKKSHSAFLCRFNLFVVRCPTTCVVSSSRRQIALNRYERSKEYSRRGLLKTPHSTRIPAGLSRGKVWRKR